MAHIRDRFIAENIKKQLRFMPSVSLLGMRQTGKTTLCKFLSESYLTLDDDSLRLKFEQGDWSDLEKKEELLCIDEIQKSPAAFDRLKLLIDQKRRPGRFLITGSVRFSSKKEISESLTGRTSMLEIYPLTASECNKKNKFSFLEAIQKFTDIKLLNFLEKRAWLTESNYKHYLVTGGLPGICFSRDESIRRAMWQAHTETLLSRDLDFIYPTKLPFMKRLLALKLVLRAQGYPMSVAELARKVGCSEPTMARVILAFEGLFLIRKHGVLDTVYFGEDLGLSNYLSPTNAEEERGKLLQFIFCELRSQLHYFHPEVTSFERITSRGGIDLPFVIFKGNKPVVAISVSDTDGATDKSLKSLTWVKKSLHDLTGIVLHKGEKGYISSTGIPCIPVRWIV